MYVLQAPFFNEFEGGTRTYVLIGIQSEND
jgi:hypothetical protein